MNIALADIGSLVAIAASLFSVVSVLYFGTVKFAKLELKVDTMWDFQMRRNQAEAVHRGVATMNSPIVVNDEARQWVEPIVAPMRAFYAKIGRKMTDSELALEIERRYGERILTEICIPRGISAGACLLIALQAVKGEATEEKETGGSS